MSSNTRWRPLEHIIYGFAIHPISNATYFPQTGNGDDQGARNSLPEGSTADFITRVDIGDEVYAFEQNGDPGNVWYRGYVVSSTRSAFNQTTNNEAGDILQTSEEPQVVVAIFPRSHIYVRDELPDAEGRLAGYYVHLLNERESQSRVPSGVDPLDNEGSSRIDGDGRRQIASPRGPRPIAISPLTSPTEPHPPTLESIPATEKPPPPRPSIKSGDETEAGHAQPLVDEIASALREWHSLLFVYLSRRDYKRFRIVKEHLEALHLGRRQLLSETLNTEETVKLRKACVARLVRGNMAQGLDVIVRHPTWGGLVTVDVDDPIDVRSWMSAPRMYAMQISSAYLDDLPVDADLIPRTCALFERDERQRLDPRRRENGHVSSSSMGSLSRVQGTDSSSLLKSSIKFYHLYLELRAFVASPCIPGETAEVYFSLYSKTGGRFLTEEFVAVLNHNGVLARDSLAKVRTLFSDLGHQDLQDTIYLVCRIIRNGGMKLSPSATSGFARSGSIDHRAGLLDDFDFLGGGKNQGPIDGYGNFRRPFGCAVVELPQLTQVATGLDLASSKEHSMPIFAPKNEASFSTLHQDLIGSSLDKFEKSPRAEMVAVTVKVFHGDSETIIRENPTLLQGTPITSRLGFPDVVFPGDIRNEVYIKLWSGDFHTTSTGGSLSLRSLAGSSMPPCNIEVTCEVRRRSGQIVEDAIALGTGEPSLTRFHSMVFYKNNAPTYGELIKLTVPEKIMPECHLFFTFRDRSSKDKAAPSNRMTDVSVSDRPFAFAYLPLFPERQAFLADGSHSLNLYKADKLSSIPVNDYFYSPAVVGQGGPLSVPSNRSLVPMRDSFTIRSFLCSTQFTANGVLVQLLNWDKVQDKRELEAALSQFTFVGEVEIVKFLRDIFDSLFAILVSTVNQDGEMDDLVFQALVTVLGIVQDHRFNNFQPVLDVYIEKHFNCAAASYHMLHSMNRLLVDPTGAESASRLRAAIKVWRYIFKFIVRARELQKSREVGMGATSEHLGANFKREIQTHLNEVNRLMGMQTPAAIIGAQTLAFQHFSSILSELADTFSLLELVTAVTTFIDASNHARGKIVIWKLMMYLQLVRGFLFDKPQSRALIVEAAIGWIKPHFGGYDEYLQVKPDDVEVTRDNARIFWLETTRLCVSIIAVMIDKLSLCMVDPAILEQRKALRQEQENVEYLLSLLPRLLDSYKEQQSPAMTQALARRRSTTTTASGAPVVFPGTYPFPLNAASSPGSKTPLPGSGFVVPGVGQQLLNVGLADTAVTIIVLILASPSKNLANFLESYIDIEGKDNTSRMLSHFFNVAISILNNDAFPTNWLNLNVLGHKVLLKISDPIAFVLLRDFIPSREESVTEEFNVQLWREAFVMLLKLLSSDQLVIEEFSPQKRRAVWRLANDIRGEGAAILLRLWEAIGWPEDMSAEVGAVTRYGGYQVMLISLVEQVLNLCLSHHDQLRSNAVQILYSMIVSEYHQSGSVERIEMELISKLDKLFMSETRGDDISRAFFVSQLRHLFDSSSLDEQLKAHVQEFLDSVDLFLELLLSVRELPEGEEFQDDRVIATLRLMNFIRRIGRDEMYIKYVHQLVNMHLQGHNYVEAALTLKLHSDLHEWDLTSFVDPMPELDLPRQSQFVRKETLCLLILDYLGKGKAWESAVEVCKELAYQHSEVTFNYQRLSEVLVHQATLLDHIMTDQRYYSEYFRVAFYGNFPVAIRDKQFIYRGYEWEKLGAFCERMLNKHPGARLLKTSGEPPEDVRNGALQYIQCILVTPEPDRSLSIFTNPDVPASVRRYYEHSAINIFSSARPIPRASDDEAASFQNTWLEKTFFTTEESFPTVLRRSEVVDVQIIETSPIENAIREVEERTRDLRLLEQKYANLAQTEAIVPTNPLAAALNNVVDLSDEGGIIMFRDLFLGSNYLAEHPDHVDAVYKLSVAIEDQVRVIGRCLVLHGSMCSNEMRPFHSILERFFRKNYLTEIERLNMIDEPLDDDSSGVLPNRLPWMPATSFNDYDQPTSPVSPSSRSVNGLVPSPGVLNRVSLRPMIKQTPLNETALKHQTPLQQHLAHLTRHGLSSAVQGPSDGYTATIDTRSESPEGTSGHFVNVGYGDGRALVNGNGNRPLRISKRFGSLVRRPKWEP